MPRTVTVYSKTPCGQCSMTKRELTRKCVDFEEVESDAPGMADLAQSIRDRAKALGIAGTMPYVTVHRDGEMVAEWFGFQPDMINAHAAVREVDES